MGALSDLRNVKTMLVESMGISAAAVEVWKAEKLSKVLGYDAHHVCNMDET
jgi:hypothetical protein